MPNHYLVIGLCGRDFNAMNQLGIDCEDVDLSPINGSNLCEIVSPIPKELRSISMAQKPSRWIHRKTGEKWEGKGDEFPDKIKEWDLVELTRDESRYLSEKFGADNWYHWSINTWGVKWGTYKTKIRKLGGDGSPVLIEFQSAWNHPNESTMKLINSYLSKEYYLDNITWIGHDPYDGSTTVIDIDLETRGEGE